MTAKSGILINIVKAGCSTYRCYVSFFNKKFFALKILMKYNINYKILLLLFFIYVLVKKTMRCIL